MSMLRNVLTYMGLGPDEDYEEGYLREADDEIDLTDDPTDQARNEQRRGGRARSSGDPDAGYPEHVEERDAAEAVDDHEPSLDGAFERPREGRRVRRAVRAERANGAATSDPHAQRERPGWLAAPAVSKDRSRSATRETVPAVEDSDGAHEAEQTHEAQDANGRGRRGAHDADSSGRGSLDAIDEIRPAEAIQPVDAVDTGREAEGSRPLRAVPPREHESTSPAATKAETMTREPEIRLVPPRILAPRSFGDAKELADEFKAIVPVVMDLQGVDRELARRLIDFASGICYAMDGSMEKIASQVFLLIPVGVEVSADERRRLEERRPTDRS